MVSGSAEAARGGQANGGDEKKGMPQHQSSGAFKSAKTQYVDNASMELVVTTIGETLVPFVKKISDQTCPPSTEQREGDDDICVGAVNVNFENFIRTKEGKDSEVIPTWTIVPKESPDSSSGDRKEPTFPWKWSLRVRSVASFQDAYAANRASSSSSAAAKTNGEEVPEAEKSKVSLRNIKKWDGHMIEMTVWAHPNFAGDKKDEKKLENVRKAWGSLWYKVVASLIRECELPIFPSSGQKFKDVYQLNEELKSGAYGAVCKGKHRASGKPFAIKIIARGRLSPSEEVDILMEASVLASLRNHPNVVHLEDFFEQERYFILIMELCEGGDLFDRIGKKQCYTEKDARDLCTRLLDAVRFCHEEAGVVHCDLKPRNLLLQTEDDDNLVKLADFGFSTRILFPESLTRQCGTPFFVAPEILKKRPYDQAVDMWSLGVIIYILLGGTMPFLGRTKRELFTAIVEGNFDFPEKYWSKISDDAKDLIRGLLVLDPRKRMSAREALKSRWIQEDAESLAQNDLQSTSKELRGFNARMKLKAAIIGVVFFTRTSFRRLNDDNQSEDTQSKESAATPPPMADYSELGEKNDSSTDEKEQAEEKVTEVADGEGSAAAGAVAAETDQKEEASAPDTAAVTAPEAPAPVAATAES